MCVCVCLGGGIANLFLAANKVLRLITDGGRKCRESQHTTYVAHVCAKCFNFGSSIRRRRHFIINVEGSGVLAGELAGLFVQIAKTTASECAQLSSSHLSLARGAKGKQN